MKPRVPRAWIASVARRASGRDARAASPARCALHVPWHGAGRSAGDAFQPLRRAALAALVVAAIAAAGTACHSKSFTPAPDTGDAGDGGPCQPCIAGLDGISIPCGATGCDVDTLYECAKDGMSVTEVGVCGGPPADAASDCKPKCDGVHCGSDGCGGTCSCNPGLTCNTLSQRCGNGCMRAPGEPCTMGSSDPQSCCEVGEECDATEAGVSVCCTSLGAQCSVDTDCCSQSCDPMSSTCK